MVQPRPLRLLTAVLILGVPEEALKSIVISTPDAGADLPDVSMLLRMFSTLVAVREEQRSQALTKQSLDGVAVQESKKLAGKLVRLEQSYQACKKVVPLEISSNGKLVRLLQLTQALEKFVPLEVSSNGKLVRLVQ